MSTEQENGAPEGALTEEARPVVADFTDSMDREEAHERERTADKPEPKPKKAKEQVKTDPQTHMVPLREVLDTRDQLRAERESRERYQRAWEEHQRKLAADQDKDPAPDMFKDPNEYNKWVERQLDKRAKAIASQHVQPLQEKISDYALRVSEMEARTALGDKRWTALNDWIEKQTPQFKQWAMQQQDPYAAAYQHYRQSTTFERLGQDDLETYEEKLKARWLAEQQAAAAQSASLNEPDDDDDDPAPAQKKPLPASFAAKPSAGRDASPGFAPTPLGAILKNKPNRQDKRQR